MKSTDSRLCFALPKQRKPTDAVTDRYRELTLSRRRAI